MNRRNPSYDALDRVWNETKPDGSAVNRQFNNNCLTIWDEASKVHGECYDGLGRLTQLWEDQPGFNYPTFYQNDALDNLTCVEQHGSAASGTGCSSVPSNDATSPWRVRRFTYNSLSQLISATNPESGTIGYSYDNGGNLKTKTASAPNQTGAATVATNYSYDVLNRLISRTYTGSPTTPPVQYFYDGITLSGCATVPPISSPVDAYPIGRRSAMCDGSGATSWTHDQLGRILKEQRIINGTTAANKAVQYLYFLDGNLNKLTYPSGRIITYMRTSSGTNTAGRYASAADVGNSINYVTGATYAPNGGLSALNNGTAIHGAFSYNSLSQPLQIFYGTNTAPSLTGSTCPSTVGNIMHRLYNFGAGSNDNGNIISIKNCRDNNRTQNFDYDSLNRIAHAYTTGTNWGESFTIDAWGNLTNIGSYPRKTNTENVNAAPASVKNQLNGFCHDAAGNRVLNAPCPTGTFTPTYNYDIENRLTTTAGYSYVYDGDGQRVKKCSNVGCTAGTLYWRDISGEPLLEATVGGSGTEEYIYFSGKRVARRDITGSVVHYYFADHLGSASVVTNATGTTPFDEDLDYYPYGGIVATSVDTVPQHFKFTGKERDTESGFDNFGARYDASSLGRFVTPDPLLNSGRPWDPQTWNRYAYAHNNPLGYVDPSGLFDWQYNAGANATDEELRKKSQDKDLSRKERNAAKDALKFRDKFRAALAAATAAATGIDTGALAAYGTEGDHNGVNVGTQLGSGAGTVLNKDDTVSVNFGGDLSGNDLAVTVAHEGQHVEDGQGWVAAGHPSLGSSLDMNHYERETRAWGVSARIAQALGMSHYGPHGGGSDYYVWNSSWHSVDRVNAAIGKIVNDLYYLTPGGTDRYSRENLPPVGVDFFDRH